MTEVQRYLAKIGRRGGIRSRRTLDPETARNMVQSREARRAARRSAPHLRARESPYPTDTTARAGEAWDRALAGLSPAQKLTRVGEICRAVDALALSGVKLRHPDENPRALHRHYAELRLGMELSRRAYGPR